jgi:hypothetical protein
MASKKLLPGVFNVLRVDNPLAFAGSSQFAELSLALEQELSQICTIQPKQVEGIQSGIVWNPRTRLSKPL